MSIKNTGEPRNFLTGVMEDVKENRLSYEKANVIVKTASQLNESIYAELKAKEVAKALGYQSAALGKMQLGDGG